jgi:hypothetical protein
VCVARDEEFFPQKRGRRRTSRWSKFGDDLWVQVGVAYLALKGGIQQSDQCKIQRDEQQRSDYTSDGQVEEERRCKDLLLS